MRKSGPPGRQRPSQVSHLMRDGEHVHGRSVCYENVFIALRTACLLLTFIHESIHIESRFNPGWFTFHCILMQDYTLLARLQKTFHLRGAELCWKQLNILQHSTKFCLVFIVTKLWQNINLTKKFTVWQTKFSICPQKSLIPFKIHKIPHNPQ